MDRKYILLLSNRLQKFKQKSSNLFNFRCPLCGDSLKNKNKSRAYFYQQKTEFWFHCHNCSVPLKFSKFLKQFDSGLYEHYLLEVLSEKHGKTFDKEITEASLRQVSLNDLSLPKLMNMSKTSAYSYIIKRNLPEDRLNELYYCEHFKSFTNTLIPDKFKNLEFDEPRIIIPFFDKNNQIFGYQGRSFPPFETDKSLRYITILLDETKPKIWGLNKIDFNYRYYIFEGPIDAMCIKNAIATAGGKISSELIKLGCNLSNAVIVYDNEPRNKNVINNMSKAITSGFSIVIWPSYIQYKDVNEMLCSKKYTNKTIENLLRTNTFKDLEAKAMLSQWSKI